MEKLVRFNNEYKLMNNVLELKTENKIVMILILLYFYASGLFFNVK